MTQKTPIECGNSDPDSAGAEDSVMRAVGSLDEAVAGLEDDDSPNAPEPDTVGHWITIIGRAILEIFKP